MKASDRGPNSNECSSAMPRAKSGCTAGAHEFANFTVPSPAVAVLVSLL